MKKNILLAILIGGFFIALMVIFALGLRNNPNALDLVTKGQKMPEIEMPLLLSDDKINVSNLATNNKYYLLNFWGSWCPSCYQEHPYLLELSKTETIYGINWKDTRADAINFIRQRANPFLKIIVDDNSELAIWLGVYGAPETYLVKADGTIIYRHVGVMNETVWKNDFLPKIKILK